MRIDKFQFAEISFYLSIFYRLSSPFISEMICIFPYFCPYEIIVREIRESFIQSLPATLSSSLADSNVAKSSVSKWANEYREDCLYTTDTTSDSNDAKEIRRLNQLLNEKDKEIFFLKKAVAFFAKEIDQWYIDSLTITKIYLV